MQPMGPRTAHLLTPDQVFSHAVAMHKSYTDLRRKPPTTFQKACRWETPPTGTMKLNVLCNSTWMESCLLIMVLVWESFLGTRGLSL